MAPKYVENVLELAARTREKLLVEQCISCEEVERDLASSFLIQTHTAFTSAVCACVLGTYGRGRGREAVMDVMDGVTPQWVKEITGVDSAPKDHRASWNP